MLREHWEILRRCAAMEKTDTIPVAMIVDSPWIPGYTKINTMDYYTDLNIWWKAQQQIRADFPDVIFLPDYWVEFGMSAEPSGFGCKLNFYDHQPITIGHLAESCDDIEQLAELPVPNPLRDGLMPLTLNYYKRVKEMVSAEGEEIKLVASRGPLNIITHIMGVTEFLLAVKIYPDSAHKLLKKTTALAANWLEAQADVLGTVEGVMLLDDIIGFFSPEDYMEFAHPYMKEVFDKFNLPVKFLHNDTDNPVSYPHLADMGVNIFNFTHEKPLSEVRKLVGDQVCLMGNVPPLHVLTEGTPDEVIADVKNRLADYNSTNGLILSAGGGASPGMNGENFKALISAVNNG